MGHLCRTAGYLLAKDKTHIMVVLNQGTGNSVCDAMEIPRCSIQSLRVVEPVSKKGK